MKPIMTTRTLSSILTPRTLDRILALRFPPSSTTADQVLLEARKWSQELPPDLESELQQLTLPLLRQLGQVYGPDPKELLSLLIEPLIYLSGASAPPTSAAPVLPSRSEPSFIPRAMALVFLLDQCPRMYLTNGSDPRWVAHFFDAVSQEFVWRVLLRVGVQDDASTPLPSDSLEHYEPVWSNAGYTYDQYLLMSALIFTAADHSEDIARHTILRHIGVRRRADLFVRTRESYQFLEADVEDVYAFSRWFRRGLPGLDTIGEFASLRCAVIDVHWPIMKTFGRYPFRNAAMGRKSTEAEERFLVASGRFGEVNAESKAIIAADVEAGRWAPLQQE